MIYYYCPDLAIRSSGIRLLYRHIAILNRQGIAASILHHGGNFQMPDVIGVPVRYLTAADTLSRGDVVVIPEGFPEIMNLLKEQPLRRIAIALNWSYIYRAESGYFDWRSFGIERVLVNSPFIGDFISWCMELPTHHFTTGIDPKLYFHEAAGKVRQVSYIERKKNHCDELKRVLWSRNPAFVNQVAWKGHDNLTEDAYAAEIRKSMLFLNLSPAEGLPFSMLEAMRSGALVVGYDGVGGQRELIGQGERQNCVLSGNCDYVTLAQRMEPLLADILAGGLAPWERVIRNGMDLSNEYTMEKEEGTVVAMWREILDR